MPPLGPHGREYALGPHGREYAVAVTLTPLELRDLLPPPLLGSAALWHPRSSGVGRIPWGVDAGPEGVCMREQAWGNLTTG